MSPQSTLAIRIDHPAFAGHFPALPLLPGAVLLDDVLRLLQAAYGIDLMQWHVASAKFLDIVRPGECICVQHEAAAAGLIRFTATVDDRKVASGMLSSGGPSSRP